MGVATMKQPSQSESSYRRDACILCNSGNLHLALPLAPTPIGDDYIDAERLGEEQPYHSLDLYLCGDCGNVQIEDVVDRDALFRNYIYSTSSSLGLVDHFRQYAEETLKRIRPSEGSLVLDIGSNDGSLLRAFQLLKMQVLGVDPAREIAKAATESGVETLPDYFTSELGRQLRQERGPAAVITANNVFAHSDTLPDMADGIQALLAADGVFQFEVSYLVDIIQKMLWDTIYHEHLCYHSVRSLKAFFQRHGLELFDVERISTKGGSIRGSVQKQGGPRPISPRIGHLLALEEILGLHTIDIFRDLQTRIETTKQTVLNLLKRIKAKGQSVAGYGASPTVTTLMHHFEVMDALEYLLDDNPIKQGRFSPGRHIPVHASEYLYENRVDYVLILAWNYAAPIMKRHERFIKEGGRFIIPQPYCTCV